MRERTGWARGDFFYSFRADAAAPCADFISLDELESLPRAAGHVMCTINDDDKEVDRIRINGARDLIYVEYVYASSWRASACC